MSFNLQSAARAVLYVYWPIMFAATHTPGLNIPPSIVLLSSDKFLHCMAYTALATLLAIVGGIGLGPGLRRSAIVAASVFAIVGVYGIFDELTQPFVARTADVLDWAADLVGCSIGLLIAAIITPLWMAFRDSEPAEFAELQGERQA